MSETVRIDIWNREEWVRRGPMIRLPLFSAMRTLYPKTNAHRHRTCPRNTRVLVDQGD